MGDHLIGLRPRDHEWFAGVDDVRRLGLPGGEALEGVLVLGVTEIGQRDGIAVLIVERDKEVLCVEEIAQRLLNRHEELVQILGLVYRIGNAVCEILNDPH